MDDELAASALMRMVSEAVDHKGYPEQGQEDYDENDHTDDLELAQFGSDDGGLLGSALRANGVD